MAKKKIPKPPKNDFAAEEEVDVCSFTDEPIIAGECIASFSFDDDFAVESDGAATTSPSNPVTRSEIINAKTIDFTNAPNIKTDNTSNSNADTNNNTNIKDDNLNTSSTLTPNVETLSNNKDILRDNRKAPIVNGCAPPICGEYLDVKRTYMLRSSTVRKLNELKSINHDLNTYVSTLVDLAIAHYYDHIVTDGGTK